MKRYISYAWMDNCILSNAVYFMQNMRIGKFVMSACFALILNTVPAAAQLRLAAVNDTVKTEPLQTVRADVIQNDTIPCDNYSWTLLLAPTNKGTIRKEGDNIIFTPRVDCRNDTVRIGYELHCPGTTSRATLVVIVSQMSLPVNLIDPYTPCVNDMPFNVNFEPALKYIAAPQYIATPTSNPIDLPLDGFSLPLVGDINGDGKPEIVALGLGRIHGNTDGAGWAGRAWYIHVYNGQNGQRLWSVNMGTEPNPGIDDKITSLGNSNITADVNETNDQFQLRFMPRHNSPGHIAIADLDRDGKAEIVVAEIGNLGKIYALTPSLDSATRTITGFSRLWTGHVNGVSQSYKAPYTATTSDNNHERFGSAVPYITDLNHDGRPEVIVYNKIYDGIDGLLVCTLETLNNFGYTTSSSTNTDSSGIFNNYAFVGRRPGAGSAEAYVPCFSIADIDGDGIIDIIAGSKVYLMENEVVSSSRSRPKLKRIIKGPSQVTAPRGKKGNNFTCQVNDGFTSVVDIDLDGRLDVVVFAPAENDLDHVTRSLIYVWDPLSNPTTPKAATYLYTNSGSGTFSYPFVGDINGRLDNFNSDKRLPEICMVTGRLWGKGGWSDNPEDAWSGSHLAVHPKSTSLDLGNSSFNADHTAAIEGHVLAFTYHANPNGSTPIHQRLKLSWAMEHRDESASTGITMFDFDNDGIKELVYRDELSLRIISPAGRNDKDLVTNAYVLSAGSDKSIIRLNQPGVRSYTGFEAPVIADVDLDGSADIVTTGTDPTFSAGNTSRDTRSRGYIYVFEHKGGSDKWAPCPPVWNQTVYFPLQINENLTVPPYPVSRLTPFTDRNGNITYPYNGHWVQHPVVMEGQGFTPVVRNPNAVITNMKVEVGVPSAGKTRVTLTVKNIGSASLNANTPVSFYKGGMRGTGGYDIDDPRTQFIVKLNLGEDIFPNGVAVRTFDLSQDLNNQLVWARIVDNNRVFPAAGYTDCDVSNNAASGADCPWLVYTVSASSATLCGAAASSTLTAVPANTPGAPTYQWYRNENLIAGATSAVYVARQAGTYKCFVRDDICSGFTPEAVITRVEPVAVVDQGLSINGVRIRIPILDNDLIQGCVPVVPQLTRQALHGSGIIVNDTLIYTPLPGYYGGDTLQYGLPSTAYVYITVHNVTEARNDTISVLTAESEEIDVLANDVLTVGCQPSISISEVPKHGGVYISNRKIVYSSDNHYTGRDSVTYRLQCGNEVSFARVIINVSPPRVVYVKQNASGTGDGSSWANAYGNLADPLLWAAEQRLGQATGLGAVHSPVDTIRSIWVAEGTYYPMHSADTLESLRTADARFKAFVLVNGIKIYGGFPATANDTDHNVLASRHLGAASLATTTLSGDVGQIGNTADNAYHVIVAVNIPNDRETVLDGFTISDAQSPMSNDFIMINTQRINVQAAIYCMYASPVLANLRIKNNDGYFGGAIQAFSSSPQIFNTLISGNYSYDKSGGLQFSGGSPTLTNVTVAGNAGKGSTIMLSSSTVLTLNNSIVWGNTATSAAYPYENSMKAVGGATANISHSTVQHTGGSSGAWVPAAALTDGGGNLDTDPAFVAAAGSALAPTDFSSPAINSGKNQLFPHVLQNVSLLRNCYDVNGDFRAIDNVIDMGAFEHQTWTVPPTPRIFFVKEGGSGNRSGDTWQDAYPNLADPVHWANQQQKHLIPVVFPGDTITHIWVAEGRYKPAYMAGTGTSDRDKAFVLSDGLKIYGGFPQSADDIRHTTLESRFSGACTGSPCLSPTVISGDLNNNDLTNNIRTDNAYHLIIAKDINSDGETVLDGFILSGGHANGAGHITIDGTRIEMNRGGAIYNVAASPVYANLSVEGNYAERSGGGVYSDSASSSPLFIASTISANRTRRDGGGLTLGNGMARIVNSVIAGNCTDSIGGALNIIEGQHLLLSTTIAGNHADSTGGGIYSQGNVATNVFNSIIWGNNTRRGINSNVYRDTVQTSVNNARLHYRYSVVEGSKNGNNFGVWNTAFGSNDDSNMDFYPQFINYINPQQNGWQPTSTGNYRLQYGSQALGAADTALYMGAFSPALTDMRSSTDADGNPRVFGNMDVGAYEDQTIPPPTFPIMYVKTSGSGDGSSWNQAYPNLADPLLWANMQRKGTFGPVNPADTIREIWVAAGTYKPLHKAAMNRDTLNNPTTDRDKAFVLVDGVKIYGGFPAGANNIDHSALESRFPAGCTSRTCLAPTILSGDLGAADIPGNMTSYKADNAYHVVIAAGTYSNSIFDGFIIEGGNADDNAGNFIIVNGVFIDSDKGGGLYCADSIVGSSTLFKNLVVRGNIARKHGGGMYLCKSSPTILSALVSGNLASGSAGQGIGGGMYFSECYPSLTGIIVSANTASSQGGAMAILGGKPVFTDVRISGNQAPTGAGVFAGSNAKPWYNNVTVSGNRAQTEGGGVYISGSSKVTFRNSIIWGNAAPLAPELKTDNINASFAFAHSLAGGSGGSSNWTLPAISDGGNNIDADPLFTGRVNPSQGGWQPTDAGDYTLRYCSPAIDAGNNAAHPNIASADLAGNARISGGLIDMGAYEKSLVNGLTNGRFYVKQTCRGTGSGSSWTDAYGNLADPLFWADHQRKGTFGPVAAGDTIREIWVAEGVYLPEHKAADDDSGNNPATDRDKAFVLVKGVKVYGGFPDNANNSQHTTLESRGSDMAHFSPTTLSGDLSGNDSQGSGSQYKTDNVYHVVIGADIPADGNTVLDGFIISGGQADGDNYTVEVNGAQFPRRQGGGVITVNASPLFSHIIAENNFAETKGGGMFALQSSPQIDKFTFRTNRSDGDGGGIFLDASDPEFTNVNISGNSAANAGGGMKIDACAPVFIDALVNGNSANDGGGLAVINNCQPEFINVTFGGNLAQNEGGGVSLNQANPVFKNSIVWGNTATANAASDNLLLAGSANPEYIRSLVQGSGGSRAWNGLFGTDGANNIDLDPMFENPIASGQPSTAGDYRLKNGSPAINKGDSMLYKQAMAASFLYGTQLLINTRDLDGTQRVLNGNIDVGAYEKALEIKPSNGVFFVKQNFHGDADGSSWANAYGNLADPLLWAAQQRDGSLGDVDPNDTIREIWVAQGTFRPMHFAGQALMSQQLDNDKAFVLVNGVKLYGGFPDNADDIIHINTESRFLGNCTGRACLAQTVLSGDLLDDDDSTDFEMITNKTDNAFHVIVAADISNDRQTVVDGFTVAGGYTGSASGRLELNSGAWIEREDGAGIYMRNASPVYSNLRITRNYAGNGGGVFVDGSSSLFDRVSMSGNKAKSGGALYSTGDSILMLNCALTGNYSMNDGGAVFAINSTLSLMNTSVAGNYSGSTGGGLYLYGTPSIYTVTNSIIWGNNAATPGTGNLNTDKDVNYSYSLIEDGFPGGQWELNFGADLGGNIDQPPMFVNHIVPSAASGPNPGGNYRLMHGSPAINAADTASYKNVFVPPLTDMYNELDLEGMPRLSASILDMGALEAATPIPATTRIMYVKDGTRGNGSGDSWQNAYGNLADPLLWAYMQRSRTAGAVAPGDTICEIWVASGTYYPLHKAASHNNSGLPTSNEHKSFMLVDGVKIYSGFPDNADDVQHATLASRDTRLYPATLSGAVGQIGGGADSVYHVVIASNLNVWNGESPTLDGFVITGGNAKGDGSSYITVRGNRIYNNSGGGLMAVNSNVDLKFVEITANMSKEAGGGICVKNGRLSLAGSIVSDNTAAEISGDGGGGIHADNTELIFDRVSIIQNYGNTAFGGGIRAYNGSLRADRSEFTGNSSAGGGGLFLEGTTADLVNVLIAGNAANAIGTGGVGGGIFTLDGTIRMTNVTIAGNGAVAGSALYGNQSSTMNLDNGIIWGNTSNRFSPTGNFMFRNSDIEGSGGSSAWTGIAGADGNNNIDRNPMFAGAIAPAPGNWQATIAGDYTILPGSPAANSGDSTFYMQAFTPNLPDMSGEVDLHSLPRLVGANIDMGAYEVTALLFAVHDMATTDSRTPITIDVLANDILIACNRANLTAIDTVSLLSSEGGTLTVNPDKTITYTPPVDFVGLDYFEYYIKCNTDSSAVRVDIAVLKPQAWNYIVCPGATATIGVQYMVSLTFDWYDAQGNRIAYNSATVDMVKDGNPAQTFWVEPHYERFRRSLQRGSVFPRYRITVESATDCGGTPSACAINGTLLFREDFGGNSPADPDPSTLELPQGITEYQHIVGLPSAENHYSLVKEIPANAAWHSYLDHTHPTDPTRGYMMVINAADDPRLLYTATLNGLCSDHTLNVSAWTGNLAKANTNPSTHPALRFVIDDPATGNVLAEYFTGEIPPQQNPEWKHYGFSFRTGSADIRLSIYNAVTNSGDNDLALDDVEIRLCAPPVNITQPANDRVEICEGTSFTIAGNYHDDSTFGASLKIRLERNTTSRPYDPSAWSAVNNTEITSGNSNISAAYTFAATTADTGYYRIVVASPANINRYNCRTMSRIVRLDVVEAHRPQDIRMSVKPEPGMIVNLSSYLDSLPRSQGIRWSSGISPSITPGTETTTGTVNLSSWNGFFSTYIYTCELTDQLCGTSQARAYLKIGRNYYDTLTVRVCTEIAQTERLNLNQILGLEAVGGQWNWISNTNNVFSDNITTVPAGQRHEGAYLFNAIAALAQAGAEYNHRGNPNEKKFEFEYTNPSGTMKKRVKLIVY